MVFGELMVIFRFPIVLFPNVAMVFSALLDSVIPDPPSIIELDVDMELREQAVRGITLEQEWKEMRQRVAEEKLFTKTAKAFAKQIKVSNPHDWHRKSPNRFTSGDWKK